nr:hypothetical protein [uncultured Cohaesibacter sp.]
MSNQSIAERHTVWQSRLAGSGTTLLLIGAIASGSLLGILDPDFGKALSEGTDQTLLSLVCLLFFEVQLRDFASGLANLRFIGIALTANFLLLPLIGYTIASIFMSGQPLLYTGLIIYFLAPCTDWFLSFTRMARGDTALGAALLPINMITQLLLYPVWLWIFTRHTGAVDFNSVPNILLQWFALPFVVAQISRSLLVRLLSDRVFSSLNSFIGRIIPVVTAALIFQLFALNVGTIAKHITAFGLIFAAILLFFISTFLLGDGLSRLFKLDYPRSTLLAMTTAARNAPLMLALTAIAIPDQPLVYAALIIGMLIEFPHLTALKHVLLSRRSD